MVKIILAGVSLAVIWQWNSLRNKALAAVAQAEEQGWVVTSAWRSPIRNKAVGGHSESKHMIGLAWDFRPHPTRSHAELQSIFAAHRLSVRVLPESDHLHVQIQGKTT